MNLPRRSFHLNHHSNQLDYHTTIHVILCHTFAYMWPDVGLWSTPTFPMFFIAPSVLHIIPTLFITDAYLNLNGPTDLNVSHRGLNNDSISYDGKFLYELSRPLSRWYMNITSMSNSYSKSLQSADKRFTISILHFVLEVPICDSTSLVNKYVRFSNIWYGE